MNFILLTVDCLRADHLSCYGYDRPTTPEIDDLADSGTVFTNAFSASSHTPEAIPALLSGWPPDIFSDNEYQFVAEGIPGNLSKIGYDTAGVHSNVNISRLYGYNDHFDYFFDDLYVGKYRAIARAQRLLKKFLFSRPLYYARATAINSKCLDWLEHRSSDQPFFFWAHYMDVHGPYNPPEKTRGLFGRTELDSNEVKSLFQRAMDAPDTLTEAERKSLIDLYDEEIRYTDAEIGKLLSSLYERGLLEDTVVMLTADHGDGFGENGYYNHPRRLDEELLHVPMIVSGPGWSGTNIDIPVSTLDIFPTLLKAAGETDVQSEGIALQKIRDDLEAYQDRLVFSSARGEDEEANRRRYCVQNALERRTLEVSIGGEPPNNGGSGDSLDTRLREYVRRRMKASTRVETETEGHHDVDEDEVESRLEALGYK